MVLCKKAADLLTLPQPELNSSASSEEFRLTLNHFIEKRSFVESRVWTLMLASGENTDDLTAVNNDIAETIQAALKLGDIDLLRSDFDWFRYLVMGYRLPDSWLLGYVNAYRQALELHMDDSGQRLVDWLAELESNTLTSTI